MLRHRGPLGDILVTVTGGFSVRIVKVVFKEQLTKLLNDCNFGPSLREEVRMRGLVLALLLLRSGAQRC